MKMQTGWMASAAGLALMSGVVLADSQVSASAADGMSEASRIGYTIGYTLGQRVGADVKGLDVDAFDNGFRQAYAGNPGKLSAEEMQQVIADFQARRTAQMQAEAEKMAADNLVKSNDFLAKNGKGKGVKTTASGLQYKIIKKGSGPSPSATDMVKAHYHGTLADGTVFDSSREGEPVEFPLNRVIPGWTEGLQLMNKGAKFMLFIPPTLGYGAQGAGETIGPNQALVFEVELIGFGPAPAENLIQPIPTGE